MSDATFPKPPRPWRVIAEEASHEHDAGKMAELIRELNQALQEQGLDQPIASDQQKKSA